MTENIVCWGSLLHYKHITDRVTNILFNTTENIANLPSVTLVLSTLAKKVIRSFSIENLRPFCRQRKMRIINPWFHFVSLDYGVQLLLWKIDVYIHNFHSDLQIRPWKGRVLIFLNNSVSYKKLILKLFLIMTILKHFCHGL